jgi:hypothetical protein
MGGMVDKMMIPKNGSRWLSNDGQKFRVCSTIEIDGNIWVHYIKEDARDTKTREYSCYLESFLTRFRETANECTP